MDVQAALTRKLGPLPAWTWGAVLAGGVLVYRAARGGAPSGSGAVVGVGGQGASLASPPAALDGSGSGDGGVPTATVGGDQLPGVIGRFSSAFTLQQQLNTLLESFASLSNHLAYLRDQRQRLTDQHTAGAITDAQYASRLATINHNIDTTKTQIADNKATQAGIQTQLASLFAAPAAS